MQAKKIKEIRTLVVRLLALVLIGLGVYFIVEIIREANGSREAEIDDTPLRVEQIRSILELNTLRFEDEVVVDSVVYYDGGLDQVGKTLGKLSDFNTLDEVLTNSPIEKRLTLVVKGELLYGVDLKLKDFELEEKNDTIFLRLPEPQLLSATVNPTDTDVFVEYGVWSDYARRKLMMKAKKKMIKSGEELHLSERAKEPLEKCIRQLVLTEKPIVISYYK